MTLNDLIHRYRHTIVIVSVLLPVAVAAVQSMRLHYLEQRHHQMLQGFSAAQMQMQIQSTELVQKAAACKASRR